MLTLELMAKTKFGTMDAFAEAAGISTKVAKRLINPATRLKLNDANLLIEILDIPVNLVDTVFFGTMYATRETKLEEIKWIVNHRPDLYDPMYTMIKELLAKQASAV